MQKTQLLQGNTKSLDVSKGHKIFAALYLVTEHLNENDPCRSELRTLALGLVSGDSVATQKVAEKVINILGGAVIAHIVSEKNASIIVREVRSLATLRTIDSPVEQLFGHEESSNLNNRTAPNVSQNMSFIKQEMSFLNKKNESISDNKNKRQSEILSFINNKKSVAIKDISALFPDVSEKTIQRELGVLVSSGKITKRGSKRWSLYMAVS